MACPGVAPTGGGTHGETRIEVLDGFDGEVVGDGAGRSVEADVTFVENDGGIVGGELGQGGGEIDDDAPGKICSDEFKEGDQFAFRFGVDVMSEVLTEDQDGITDEGGGEEQSTVLNGREAGDAVVGDGFESTEGEESGRALGYLTGGETANAKHDGAGEGFLGGKVGWQTTPF